MENFTPVSAAIGGALIGLSAVWLMASAGRIAGISSIFGGIASAEPGDKTFLLGLFVESLFGALI